MQSKLELFWSAKFYHTLTAIYRHNIATCSIKKSWCTLPSDTMKHSLQRTRAHNTSSGALNGWLSLFIREWMRQYVYTTGSKQEAGTMAIQPRTAQSSLHGDPWQKSIWWLWFPWCHWWFIHLHLMAAKRTTQMPNNATSG